MIRRLAILVLGPLLIMSLTIQPVFANHSTASGYVSVWHGSNMIATYSTTGAACTGTSCSIYVVVPNKRDLGRASRWGCTSYPTSVYHGNTTAVGQYCYNPQQFDWYFIFGSSINATHTSDVTITVYVVAGP